MKSQREWFVESDDGVHGPWPTELDASRIMERIQASGRVGCVFSAPLGMGEDADAVNACRDAMRERAS